LNQKITDLEVIAVNDGSTDSSLEILAKIGINDTRLKIINQNNLGVSAARNAGIKCAKGEFLGFVDNDDHVHSDMFLKLYNAAKKNQSDIVACGCISISGNNFVDEHFHDSKTYSLDESNILPFLTDIYLIKSYRQSCWNKIYKANIIKNNIEFIDRSKVISEDLLFNFNVLLNSKRISVL
jgi:glycosyltransferase EpsH